MPSTWPIQTGLPIVFTFVGMAVEKGIVASLARPGGNATGISFQGTLSKLLQLFKEAVPTLGRVAFLYDPATAGGPFGEGRTPFDPQAAKVEVQFVALRDPTGVTQAFAEFQPGTNGLLLDGSTNVFLTARQICGLALQRKLPTLGALHRVFPDAGCLMSYGDSTASVFRSAASLVDKIIKGAKPAELPVEQPTKFELVINLKTAKALGLTLPQTLLERADTVIR